MSVPGEAIAAAYGAAKDRGLRINHADVTAMLDAAAPLIAATERGRIRLSPELRGATFLARDGDGREVAAVPWSVVADLLLREPS